MDTNRTAPLWFIAIVACAVLPLTPDSYRNGGPDSTVPATQAKVRGIQPQSAFRFDREVSEPAGSLAIAPAEPLIPAVEPIAETQPIDWALVMYPELARIEALENEPAGTALDELSVMLSSDDPAIRLAVIEALGDMTLKEALPGLMTALNDPNSQLRLAALQALAAHNDRSVASVIESVLYDSDTEVRVAAIKTLADLDSDVSVHALASLLSDPEASIRHQAVYALGDIGGRDATMYLLQARYDPVATIRRDADAILAELEYEAAF